MTNAHVVAGEQRHDGRRWRAPAARSAREPIAFDPRRRHRGAARRRARARRRCRSARDPASGTSGAILGYPENGPFDAEPARIGRTQDGRDRRTPTGAGPVTRLLTPLRGLVRPGNSGGPVVDGAGHVLTTVFAATVGAAGARRLRGGQRDRRARCWHASARACGPR